MSRANPFSDLDDFASDGAAKPVPADASETIAKNAGFPSRKAGNAGAGETAETLVPSPAPTPGRAPRRHTTGRNRQINIKATEETIEELYRIADKMGVPLGAVLERALVALAKDIK